MIKSSMQNWHMHNRNLCPKTIFSFLFCKGAAVVKCIFVPGIAYSLPFLLFCWGENARWWKIIVGGCWWFLGVSPRESRYHFWKAAWGLSTKTILYTKWKDSLLLWYLFGWLRTTKRGLILICYYCKFSSMCHVIVLVLVKDFFLVWSHCKTRNLTQSSTYHPNKSQQIYDWHSYIPVLDMVKRRRLSHWTNWFLPLACTLWPFLAYSTDGRR